MMFLLLYFVQNMWTNWTAKSENKNAHVSAKAHTALWLLGDNNHLTRHNNFL